MNQNDSIKVKDIIHYIGVILLGLFLFYSFIYYFDGNIVFSAVGTLIATLLLGIGLTYILVKLKTVTQYHKKMFVWEILVLVIGYVMLFIIPTGYLLSKLVTVEFSEKENIRGTVLSQVQEINTMFEVYEEHVNNKANNYEVELENDGETPSSVSSKLITLNETLQDTDYFSTKNKAKKFVSQSKGIIKSWNRLKVPKVLAETYRLKQNWYNELVNKSNTHEDTNEFGTFEYNFQDNEAENLLNPPLKNTNWILVVLMLLIIHSFILWPYFFAQRSTRPKGHGADDGLII